MVVFLGKTLFVYFPLGPSSLPVVVAQPDESVANRTQKVLYAVVCWTDTVCLVHAIEQMMIIHDTAYTPTGYSLQATAYRLQI